MSQFFTRLNNKGIALPSELTTLLNSCKSYTVYDTVEQLAEEAMGGSDNGT